MQKLFHTAVDHLLNLIEAYLNGAAGDARGAVEPLSQLSQLSKE